MADLREAQRLMKAALDRALNRALRGPGSDEVRAAIDKAERVGVKQSADGIHCALYELEEFATGEAETFRRRAREGEEADADGTVEDKRPVMGRRPTGAPILDLAEILRRADIVAGDDPAVQASKRAAVEIAAKGSLSEGEHDAFVALGKITGGE